MKTIQLSTEAHLLESYPKGSNKSDKTRNHDHPRNLERTRESAPETSHSGFDRITPKRSKKAPCDPRSDPERSASRADESGNTTNEFFCTSSNLPTGNSIVDVQCSNATSITPTAPRMAQETARRGNPFSERQSVNIFQAADTPTKPSNNRHTFHC